MNKIIISFFLASLFLIVGASAEPAIVTAARDISAGAYLAFITVIIILCFIIYSIRKLNYDLMQILKSVFVSLLITIAIEILFFIIGMTNRWFLVFCKTGGYCPTPYEIYFSDYLPRTAAIIFLVTIFVYYVIVFFKNKSIAKKSDL